MLIIERSYEFDKWLKNLNDLSAKAKILYRIQKLEYDEHFGDCAHVGDKSSQSMDIKKAKMIWNKTV
jgi:putative component of toxin-antitoxin plasmid stabilization module